MDIFSDRSNINKLETLHCIRIPAFYWVLKLYYDISYFISLFLRQLTLRVYLIYLTLLSIALTRCHNEYYALDISYIVSYYTYFVYFYNFEFSISA